jgi:hypothetical protein
MSGIRTETPAVALLQHEVHAMNREFLALLTRADLTAGTPVLGLDTGIVASLQCLTPAQLDRLAAAPVLLADFTALPGRRGPTGHRPGGVAEVDLPAGWRLQAQSFARCLLTSLWHFSRRNDALSRFCLGLDAATVGALAALDFAELHRRADATCASLTAAHADRPECWAAMVRALVGDDLRRLWAAQLSLIPLTVARQCLGD